MEVQRIQRLAQIVRDGMQKPLPQSRFILQRLARRLFAGQGPLGREAGVYQILLQRRLTDVLSVNRVGDGQRQAQREKADSQQQAPIRWQCQNADRIRGVKRATRPMVAAA